MWDFEATAVKGACDKGTRLRPALPATGPHPAPGRAARRRAHHQERAARRTAHHRTEGARTAPHRVRTTAPAKGTERTTLRTTAPGVESTVRSGLHSVDSTAPDGRTGWTPLGLRHWVGAPGGTVGEWTPSDPPSTAGRAPPCPPLLPPIPPTSPPKTGSTRGRRDLRPRALPRSVRLRPRPPAARRRRRRGRRRGTGGPGRPPACTRSGTRPRSTRCARRRPRGTTA